MTGEQDNMSTLRSIYDAYNAKDIRPLMDALADDMIMREHASPTLPWGGEWKGADGMQRFVECVVQEMDHQSYTCDDMIGQGDTVVAWGNVDTRCQHSGKPCSSAWVHRVHFRDGKIVEINEFYDTLGFAEQLGRI